MKPKKEQSFQASNQILSAQELNRLGNGQPLSVNVQGVTENVNLFNGGCAVLFTLD